MSEPLTSKHRPQTLSDVQGNTKDIGQIENWAENWAPGDSPLLFVGSPGVGKTATAQALANDMGWEMVEINASSARTSDDIESIASQMDSKTVDGGHKLLFLDEIDSIHRSTNIRPLTDRLSNPPCPIIMAANDEWKISNGVKRPARKFEFSLSKSSIKARIRKIAKEEGIDISAQDIGKLATRGNLRAAINDLQTYAETGEMDWDDRQTELDNFQMVDNVFEGKRYTGDMTPDEVIIWLEENLSEEFRGIEAAAAYDALARADKWHGRARRTGNYHWWRYAGRLADAPADLRVTEPYGGWIDKSYPQHYRSSTPKADDSDPEAQLYRTLKGYETGEFNFAGDYHYFRHAVLPQIQDFPEAVRHRLAIEHSIQPGDDELEALNLSTTQYENWLHEEFEDEQSQLAQW